MKTAAILVVYTDAFVDRAVQLFTKVVRRHDPQCSIIVVSNNHQVDLNKHPGVVALKGNNLLHEFGAWQIGLDYLRRAENCAGIKVVWFANDTFCHYRPMGAMEEVAFVRGANSIASTSRSAACGELSPSPWRKTYEFDGVSLNSWIATYLFVLNRSALDALNWSVVPQLTEVRKWVRGGHDEAEFFSPNLDSLIKKHFENWLFGPEGKTRWRRAGRLTAENSLMMQGKADALICEQYLTANLLRQSAKLTSVFHLPIARAIRKLLEKI